MRSEARTYQCVVADLDTKVCAIIDLVPDFDPNADGTATYSAAALLSYIDQERFELHWIVDIGPDADQRHWLGTAHRKGKPLCREF